MKHPRLGQHFLTRPELATAVADAVPLLDTDTVLEIGPGHGILTRVLLERVERVVALEKDLTLLHELKETFAESISSGSLILLDTDVRNFDPTQETTLGDGYHLIANIPYYITGAILRQFLSTSHQPKSMSLLVQKEVAERVVAAGGKESLLSLSVKAYGTPRYVRTIKRGSFSPAPKVDSAILAIENISRDRFHNEAMEQLFFKLIHAGFGAKRKQLGNLLANIVTDDMFAACEVTKNARAEDVPLERWICLAEKVTTMSR